MKFSQPIKEANMTFFLINKDVILLRRWTHDKEWADFHLLFFNIDVNFFDDLDLSADHSHLADTENSLLWQFSKESVLISSAWHDDVPALAG